MKRGLRKEDPPEQPSECSPASELPKRTVHVLPETGSKLQRHGRHRLFRRTPRLPHSFLIAYLKEPHGKWDAWLIWNMHARFLYRGGDAWREAFASGLDWSHWDYPLLLPLSIVRGWTLHGR